MREQNRIARVLMVTVLVMLILAGCERPIRGGEGDGGVIDEAITTVEDGADLAVDVVEDGTGAIVDAVTGEEVDSTTGDEGDSTTVDQGGSADDGSLSEGAYPAAGEDGAGDNVDAGEGDVADAGADAGEGEGDSANASAEDGATDAEADTGSEGDATEADTGSEGDATEADADANDNAADTGSEGDSADAGGEDSTTNADAENNTADNDAGSSDSADTSGEDGSADSAGERIHVVQPGETMFRIGLQYGMSWVQIAEANGITNPNNLSVGQELKIPSTTPNNGVQPEFTHVVQPGDTIFLISLRYGKSWEDIANANNLSAPYTIYPGDTITIPGG